MKVGIIGYGSMGKMLAGKFAVSGKLKEDSILVSSRTKEKLKALPAGVDACSDNMELAALADIIFLCVKPGDLKEIVEEIKPVLKRNALLVSLNGSVSFALLERITDRKIAKVWANMAKVSQKSRGISWKQLISLGTTKRK